MPNLRVSICTICWLLLELLEGLQCKMQKEVAMGPVQYPYSLASESRVQFPRYNITVRTPH